MHRRWSLGLALSLVVHASVVGGLVGWSWLRGATPSRIDVDIAGMSLEELKDLPLGAPPAGERPHARPRPRAPAPPSSEREGTLATREERGKPVAADTGADDVGPGPTDLAELGPEGSRFT